MKNKLEIEVIAAVDEAWGIGRGGKIPWRVPGDMAFFRSQTLGHPTLMGRKTFESIGARPLVQRPCAVWTHFPERIACAKDCYASSDLDALLAWCSRFEAPIFVIGGAEVYRAMLDRAAVLWISQIPGCHDCDTFFPEISKHKLEKSEIMDGFVLEKYILDCFE